MRKLVLQQSYLLLNNVNKIHFLLHFKIVHKMPLAKDLLVFLGIIFVNPVFRREFCSLRPYIYPKMVNDTINPMGFCEPMYHLSLNGQRYDKPYGFLRAYEQKFGCYRHKYAAWNNITIIRNTQLRIVVLYLILWLTTCPDILGRRASTIHCLKLTL